MADDRLAVHAAVYLILIRNDQILLLRRYNTGWMNGMYTPLAGHLDTGESLAQAMCREAKEEAGIVVEPEDLSLVHVMHSTTNRDYLDFYFSAEIWSGEPKICEPDKCDDMRWFPIGGLPDNLVPNAPTALGHIRDGIMYSEMGWRQ